MSSYIALQMSDSAVPSENEVIGSMPASKQAREHTLIAVFAVSGMKVWGAEAPHSY